MSEKNLRPSGEWADLSDITVLDPDGWDRTNFEESWAEPITWEEFKSRTLGSTSNAQYVFLTLGSSSEPEGDGDASYQ